MQPARLHSALHRNQFAAHRPAHLPCITAHRANATSPRASHRIANNPRTVQRAARTYNQPVEVRASHPVQRPRIALRGPHTLLSTLRWFRFVWFVELFFLKFNIYTFLFLNISWLIRHTG
jgi:hypothetical protein